MKFFLDTADLVDIQEAAALGILDGVTTNPSLMAKVGVPKANVNQHYVDICEAVGDGDVSAEVIGTDYATIVGEGRQLAGLHPNIVVKIPFIPEGVKAMKTLSEEGIRINCTLIFSPLQALIAAKAGASFVSPFIGRLDDIGHDGMELVEQTRQIFDNYEIACEILAASLRHSKHILDAALLGADVATMPKAVLMQLFKHPLTDSGLAKFLSDYNSVK